MANYPLWRKALFCLVILSSQIQFLRSQVPEKSTISPPVDSSSATEKPGINLSDSFFIRRLRQGHFGALKDFHSLRQTLTIPENQQKHFTNFLQQQNPFYRFALWNMMQNSLIHGLPNSHALNRMGLPTVIQSDSQQLFPAQQYLNLLQQNRGGIQVNTATESTDEKNIDTAADVKDVVLKEINIPPDTTRSILKSSVSSQSNPSFKLTASNSQLGQLGMDRLRDALRTKVNKSSLNHTISLIEQVLKNRAASKSQSKGVQNAAENSAEIMQLNGLPKGFILQYVGNIFGPNIMNTNDMSPRQTELVDNQFDGKVNGQETSSSQIQRTTQFVGNVFGNNGLQAAFDVPLARDAGNERITNNAFDPIVTGQLISTDSVTNVRKPTTDSNLVDTSSFPTRAVFLRFVGDLTGADLIGARSEINALAGESNPSFKKLFSDARSVGMRGNIISASSKSVSTE